MRPFFISVLAATLIGCCFAPVQTQQASLTGCTEANGLACSDGAAGAPQTDSKPPPVAKAKKAIAAKKENFRRRREVDSLDKNAKSNIAPKTDASSSAQPDDKSNTVTNEKSNVTEVKAETPQSFERDDKSDPVIKKAKATIAAKMDNPASVEFVEMKRGARKDALDRPIDTICGYVRGKTGSGGDTGDTPFLYLVQEDEAYIGATMATTAYRYRNICK